MASITYRVKRNGSKVYQARVRRGSVYVVKTFMLKVDAQNWARAQEVSITNGTYLQPVGKASLTAGEAFLRYAEEKSEDKKFGEVEAYRLGRLARLPLGQKRLVDVTSVDIANFIRARRTQGKANNTIRLDLAAMSCVFRVAAREWGYIHLENPVLKVDRPRPGKFVVRRFEDGELARISDHLPDDMNILVRVAIATALRRTELCKVRWRDVDLEDGWLHNIDGKNGEVESIPLSKAAVELFRKIPQGKPNERVFQRSPNYISQRFSKSARRAGIDDIHFHVTRHEATSQFFERELPLDHVMAITRHKTPKIALQYNHARKKNVKAALDRSDLNFDDQMLR